MGNVRGVFVQANGDVLVADYGADRVLRIPGGTGSAINVGSGWNSPTDVFATSNGDVWVSDNRNDQIKVVRGGAGTPEVFAPTFSFNRPWGVFVAASGSVYVTDSGSGGRVLMFAYGDGAVAPTSLCPGYFRGLFVTPQNATYVADSANGAVKMCSNGTATTVATGFASPYDVSVTAAGDVYVLQATATPSVIKLPGGNGSAAEGVAGTSNIGGYPRSFYIDGTVYSGA